MIRLFKSFEHRAFISRISGNDTYLDTELLLVASRVTTHI